MAKELFIFKISRYWMRCTVWHGDSKTKELVGRSSVTPDKGIKQGERKRIITKWLREVYGVPDKTLRELP